MNHPRWIPWILVAVAVPLFAIGRTAADDGSPVPLKKVVLYNSGVGFFERGGTVSGNARLELKFRAEAINDLLKSMVLQDLGGGQISTVTYSSRDPVTKTLKTFAIDLTSNPTLAQLLAQIRGERIEIEGANPMAGIIVGTETRKERIGRDQVVEKDFLNLLTESGLRSVALEGIGQIRLADARLDAELRQALAILALGHANDKKTVTLEFTGQGEREVRVGYIQEAPIWKTSYRLVLDAREKPFLQGWAIVENTTEEDWNDVHLTLVSGRPISFRMDLYQPLYVQRPLVKPDLYASLGPVVYGQDLQTADNELVGRRRVEPDWAGAIKSPTTTRSEAPAPGDTAIAAAPAPPDARGMMAGMFGSLIGGPFSRGASTPTVAQAENVGELFQYAIAAPVDLPRQQSAMLPIVNQTIEAERLSIYNKSVQAKHPLNGLRIKNTTDLHLMQGPVTVFDGGAYAGDARIEDLQPGTERLVSYALDLDVEVAPESAGERPDTLRSVSIVKGVVHTKHIRQRHQKYVVKSSAATARELLIEHPFDANWTLVAPKEPKEKTRDQYRFALTTEPGKPTDLVIEEQRTFQEEYALTNIDDRRILLYVNAPQVSENVKEALREVIRRKAATEQLAAQRTQREQQIQAISQEQDRIRQNMEQLDRDTDLYRRYVQKFGEQEDQVEKLRTEIARLLDEETAARQSLDEYLVNLEAE